jgi:hypothetical protein
MRQTSQVAQELRDAFEARGGEPLWSVRDLMGRLEMWTVAGELRLLHLLPANGGVNVYAKLSPESVQELVQ